MCLLVRNNGGKDSNLYYGLSLPNHGGIPSPSGGVVGKNRSTRRKTTVRSKRVGPQVPEMGIKKNLRALTLVGPMGTSLVLDLLDVLRLDN